ncbi:hypothetical protein THASP1DRAFT_27377 [Thamnocephalis sphaerospora]|uniref:Uncharacterized protein n=1 Tax=Thamnocephalis sphaerospora TaxID=78915 RepID=A0A4P9XWV1_9FUNG|nr:hypothetical protein THASP1DRAFT_27377 [Thamnocephalis sphaerospora]|eukprot:RKP10838.1 hypothetical protein THASP1DRAFT_27377 [Thamnocephalis sphaerospora]
MQSLTHAVTKAVGRRQTSIQLYLANRHPDLGLQQLQLCQRGGVCQQRLPVAVGSGEVAAAKFATRARETAQSAAFAYRIADREAQATQSSSVWIVVAWEVAATRSNRLALVVVNVPQKQTAAQPITDALATLLDRVAGGTPEATGLRVDHELCMANHTLLQHYVLDNGRTFTVDATISDAPDAELRVTIFTKPRGHQDTAFSQPAPQSILAPIVPHVRKNTAGPGSSGVGPRRKQSIPDAVSYGGLPGFISPGPLNQTPRLRYNPLESATHSTGRGAKDLYKRLSLAIHNSHPTLHLTNAALYTPRTTCVPVFPETLAPNAAARTFATPEPGARNSGTIVYRILELAQPEKAQDQREPPPHAYLAVTWELSTKHPKRVLARVIHVDHALAVSESFQSGLLFRFMASELRTSSFNHTEWRGHLRIGNKLHDGCSLYVHIDSEMPLRINVVLDVLTPTLPPGVPPVRPPMSPTWLIPGGTRYITSAGCRARARLREYADELTTNAQDTIMFADASAAPLLAGTAFFENRHPRLIMSQEAMGGALMDEASIRGHAKGDNAVLYKGIGAFAVLRNSDSDSSEQGHVLYQLGYDSTSPPSSRSGARYQHHFNYLVAAWAVGGGSRSYFVAELVRAEQPWTLNNPTGRCVLQLIERLGRAERGERVYRETVLMSGARMSTSAGQQDNSALAMVAHLNMDARPVLSMETMPSFGITSGYNYDSIVHENSLPMLQLTVENMHPSLVLDMRQTYLVSCDTEGTSNAPAVSDSLAYGDLHSFCFRPTSQRQLGMLLYRIREAQPIRNAPLLIVAWRQNTSPEAELLAHANVFRQHGDGEYNLMLPKFNLHPTVYTDTRRVFVRQAVGKLSNGAQYTVTMSLYRPEQSNVLEMHVCFTTSFEDKPRAPHANPSTYPRMPSVFTASIWNMHPNFQLLSPDVYSMSGVFTEWPQGDVKPGKAAMIQMAAGPSRSDTKDQNAAGLMLARLGDLSGNPIPNGAHLIVCWQVIAGERHFYVSALSFEKSPVERLRSATARNAFYQRLLQPRLMAAGNETLHHKMLISGTPGMFLWASMARDGAARLDIMIRQPSNLPLHALSATPTLASRHHSMCSIDDDAVEPEADGQKFGYYLDVGAGAPSPAHDELEPDSVLIVEDEISYFQDGQAAQSNAASDMQEDGATGDTLSASSAGGRRRNSILSAYTTSIQTVLAGWEKVTLAPVPNNCIVTVRSATVSRPRALEIPVPSSQDTRPNAAASGDTSILTDDWAAEALIYTSGAFGPPSPLPPTAPSQSAHQQAAGGGAVSKPPPLQRLPDAVPTLTSEYSLEKEIFSTIPSMSAFSPSIPCCSSVSVNSTSTSTSTASSREAKLAVEFENQTNGLSLQFIGQHVLAGRCAAPSACANGSSTERSPMHWAYEEESPAAGNANLDVVMAYALGTSRGSEPSARLLVIARVVAVGDRLSLGLAAKSDDSAHILPNNCEPLLAQLHHAIRFNAIQDKVTRWFRLSSTREVAVHGELLGGTLRVTVRPHFSVD